MAQFESLFGQLSDLSPKSESAQSWVKAKLIDVANQYQLTQVRQTGLLSNDHLEALKDLRNNADLVILQPDKGSGIVLLDRTDYVAKMEVILSDRTKFMVDDKGKGKTESWERKMNKKLNSLLKEGRLDRKTVMELKARGSQLPQLYGLPKLHKPGIPLRPIFSTSSLNG